uniref:Kallikrein-1E2-like n=1 Tax=Castor canadensis TaxID=51338 RepID=A0A8B7U8F0_CASCN|nr:kallikrein-1E2-like [Castor canadensis]
MLWFYRNIWITNLLGGKETVFQAGAVPHTQSRIMEGWECMKNSQPWQVVVVHKNKYGCRGVLVYPQWVLMAVHCKDPSHDLMLLCLTQPVQITEAVKPVNLPPAGAASNQTGTECSDSGGPVICNDMLQGMSS